MANLAHIEEQLKRIGSNFRFWGRSEIRELPHILMDDEIIAGCVNGRYEGGFAMLCVTNHRMLLIDRKPMFLTLEDIRFDMVAEIDFAARLLDSTLHVITPNRKLVFTSWSHHRLRQILTYTQQRVMEIRQHYLMQQFQPQQQPVMMPNSQYSAPMVGGLALQGNDQAAQTMRMAPYPNPYTKVPLMMRRRNRLPRF
jgi:hypothetical protein